MNLQDFFPSNVDPNLISVYVGKVVKVNDDFIQNGTLYVDITDPNGTDLDKIVATAKEAKATTAIRLLYDTWENPPEIRSKANFSGSMSFTSTGDFHLRNYCFDMLTQSWFMTVSSALNAIGIVNTPPVMVGLDLTPFPGKAVAVNVSLAARESVDEAIKDSLRSLTDKSVKVGDELPTLEQIVEAYHESQSSRSSRRLLRSSSPSALLDLIVSVVKSFLTDSFKQILLVLFKPYYDLIEIIKSILNIYEKSLSAIGDFTFPITQFANITPEGDVEDPNPLSDLSIKNLVLGRIQEFNDKVEQFFDEIGGDFFSFIEDTLVESISSSILSVLSDVESEVMAIVNPIKDKVTELIDGYIRPPVTQITTLISSNIQPTVSSLPAPVQMAVKTALKKVLDAILGTPIKYLLAAVTTPIDDLIDQVLQKIGDQVGSLLSSTLSSMIEPTIAKIQQKLMSFCLPFDLEKAKNKLKEIEQEAEGYLSLPKIYMEKAMNPLKPYKSFTEINWSDPKELCDLILGLIKSLGGDKLDPILDRAVEIKNIVTDIYKEGEEIWGSGHLDQEDGGALDAFRFLKHFASKADFLPTFLREHPAIKAGSALLDLAPYKDIEVKEWLTNSLSYVNLDINKVVGSYICNPSNEPKMIEVLGHTITLEPCHIYLSESVSHTPKDSNDPVTGEDLVPKLDENNNPIPLLMDKLNEAGDILYKYGSGEATFKEITDALYAPMQNEAISKDALIQSLILSLEEGLQESADLEDIVNQSEFLKSLLYEPYILTLETSSPSLNAGRYSLYKDTYSVEVTVSTTEIHVTIQTAQTSQIKVEEPTEEKAGKTPIRQTLVFSLDGLHITDYNTRLYLPVNALNVWTYVLFSGSYTESYFTTTKIKDSSSFYAWVQTASELLQVKPKDLMDTESSESLITDIFQTIVSAIGQEGDIDLTSLIKGVLNKVTGSFGDITGLIDSVKEVITSLLERLSELHDITDIIGTIHSVAQKAQDIADTAGPILEATAKAASVPLPQSCSMTQAAKGTDFTFSSGDAYYLSTITEPKAQLPYCKELMRETFLEVGTKVLVLAVGAGQKNLYVVDILS